MKKMLLLSAALLAVLAGPALAQRQGEGGRPDRFQRDRPAQGQVTSPTTNAAPPAELQHFNRSNDNRANENRGNENRANDNRGNDNRGNAGRDNGRRDFGRNDNDRRWDNNRGNDRRDFGRNDNDRRWDNNRYDGRRDFGNRRYSQYYRNWNSQNRFRAGAYYRPQGFSYRRWSYGDILPSLFWSNRYWLNNYNAYDLPPPPPGTVWVRYGDDALLIDRYSGEVIQVSYSVFW